MEMIPCPGCDESLPASANYCGTCGETLAGQDVSYFTTIKAQDNFIGAKPSYDAVYAVAPEVPLDVFMTSKDEDAASDDQPSQVESPGMIDQVNTPEEPTHIESTNISSDISITNEDASVPTEGIDDDIAHENTIRASEVTAAPETDNTVEIEPAPDTPVNAIDEAFSPTPLVNLIDEKAEAEVLEAFNDAEAPSEALVDSDNEDAADLVTSLTTNDEVSPEVNTEQTDDEVAADTDIEPIHDELPADIEPTHDELPIESDTEPIHEQVPLEAGVIGTEPSADVDAEPVHDELPADIDAEASDEPVQTNLNEGEDIAAVDAEPLREVLVDSTDKEPFYTALVDLTNEEPSDETCADASEGEPTLHLPAIVIKAKHVRPVDEVPTLQLPASPITIEDAEASPDEVPIQAVDTDQEPAQEVLASQEDAHDDAPAPLKVPYIYAIGPIENGTPLSQVRGTARPATVNASRRSRSGLTTSPLLYSDTPAMGDFGGFSREPGHQATWHKDVDVSSDRISTTITPRPSQPRPILLTPQRSRRRVKPFAFFWGALVVIIALVLAGVFGVFATLGHGWLNSTPGNLSLLVTPNSVAIGATMTLRGSNFTPSGRIGLTRDSAVPISDTAGNVIIEADTSGNFTDTVVVTPDWSPGSHTINTEDASSHKSALFSILVTGKSTSLRPAHLLLSANTLDLGSGDQATNSTRTITLSNIGGGQISWKSSATQPWLLISPSSGTFVSGQSSKVTIAADRSNLPVGPHTANVIFSSSAGMITLPVKIQVTPLIPGHEAVMQLTPAVLSFTAVDGGTSPPAQVVTVSDPGVQTLQWSASADANWLAVSPQTGSVNSASAPLITTSDVSRSAAMDALDIQIGQMQTGATDSQPVTISVNTSSLLPGSYSGVVTFSSTDATVAKNSPQSVYINVTILPQCALQISPGILSFAGVSLQPAPAPKIITIGNTLGCSTPLHWTASSDSSWLTISTTNGLTPSFPSVGINIANMTPGTYNGSLTFSSSVATQTLPVTFTMGQPTTPIMTTTPATMSFIGIEGQAGPAAQTITITNTGGGALSWHIASSTAVGGNWLTATPASGNLTANQSATVSVSASVLKSLIPGTYNGTLAITGIDGSGNAAGGSPQAIPISFLVQAACTVTPTPLALNFAGTLGQTNPAMQAITLTASGACANTLNWTATATTTGGGTWLSATPATGSISLSTTGTTNAAVSLSGLKAGTYTGTLTFTATDSVTNAAVGATQAVTVTLTVQPPCTLQTPSATTLTYTTEGGSSPAAQTFTLSVTGACTGNVTITPTATLGSGSGWLTVTPATATIVTGGSATFTAAVIGTSLTAGSYTASISLTAINAGVAIVGSPQSVGVALTVTTPPTLLVSPASQTINVTTGTTSQPFTITNSGSGTFNWKATLASGTPSFISLSATSGSTLASGASVTDNVVVDATGATGGKSYTVNVTVTATDPSTNKAAAGSPATLPITVNVAAPAMQVSATTLSFASTGGSTPASQSVVITNTGGNSLKWTVSTPSQSWLTVSPKTGTDTAGATSTVAFSANVGSLVAGTYTTTVTVTPSVGSAQTITVTFTVS